MENELTLDNVKTVLKGKVTAEPLISLWRHYPEFDLKLDPLVEATIRDYKKHPSDLIKLSPHGRYCVVDFGCDVSPGSREFGDTGASSCKKCVVQTSDDWRKISEIDPLDGHYGMQLEYVRQIRKQFPETAIMMTVFSPTMVARKLSKNQMPDHLLHSDDNSLVKEALSIIDKSTTEFALAAIDAGADGIFSAVQEADRSVIPNESDIIQLIRLNKNFMSKIKNRSEFTVLHLHGEDVMFEKAINELEPTAVNWHDQTVAPSLEEARKVFSGGLLGGLEPQHVLDGKIDSQIKRALTLKEEIPLILAPGCVLLQGTPEETLNDIFNNYKN